MNSALCNRCGTCVGLSDGKIIFKDKEGDYRPLIVDNINDQLAERLWKGCAGKYFDFNKYNDIFYSDSVHFHNYLGSYQKIYIGNATDQKIRLNSASGGILSAILIYLLDKGEIDGAVTLRMNRQTPWLSEPFIATTREGILEAAQSKYTISSVNEILSVTASFNGILAYVGLPGQVQSIRKLQDIDDPSVNNIKYIFGPYYGNTLHFSSVISFLKSYGIKDYKQISKLYFRHGEWPGNMRVELDTGRIIELKKFHANYLIPFHILRNSLYCTDLSNEFTDLSGGDAWAPVYEEKGKGFSIFISRTKQGQDIVTRMIDDGWIDAKEIREEESIIMHSHGFDFKKRGAFIRIKFRKWIGRSIPDYGYKISGFPLSRYLMEVVISSMFILFNTGFARWVVEKFPPSFVGKVFMKARYTWKKTTKKTKLKYLV
ncbi:MAG: Coenzyme F420 hydrogenase/dehydrogenase, beta subunit C-terminal domain [Bacteroidetes bacterium]|nr:Coenzyme F420 hydrogenase/dehydrogenase, beta subunit C-terminal domain [Bacteroidota bacterium]